MLAASSLSFARKIRGDESNAKKNATEASSCEHASVTYLKVHLTPKYFFRLKSSLHLFETQCAYLPFSCPNLDFLQAVKVKKSGHRLFHGRASKGNGFIPGLTSQTFLHAR